MDSKTHDYSRRRFIKSTGKGALYFGIGAACIGAAAATGDVKISEEKYMPDGYSYDSQTEYLTATAALSSAKQATWSAVHAFQTISGSEIEGPQGSKSPVFYYELPGGMHVWAYTVYQLPNGKWTFNINIPSGTIKIVYYD